MTKTYQVCLSFAGEDRTSVEPIAKELSSMGVKVFYDKYEEVELWGKDLYQHLDDVYRNRADFCVVFISAAYAKKLWTRHELRSAQARAFRENREYILPLRLDDTAIPGIPETVGYIDLRNHPRASVIDLITKKLSASASTDAATDSPHPLTNITAIESLMQEHVADGDDPELWNDRYIRLLHAGVRGEQIREYNAEGASKPFVDLYLKYATPSQYLPIAVKKKADELGCDLQTAWQELVKQLIAQG